VASASATKPVVTAPAAVWPSRLIPGGRVQAGDPPRKKAASVAIDGRYWSHQDRIDRGTPKQGIRQSAATKALPSPATQNQRGNLLVCVAGDYGSIAIGFLIVHGYRLVSTRSLHLRALPAVPVGLWLIYAMLFTLLGYSERLYHPEVLQEPRGELLITAKVSFWSASLFAAALAFSNLALRSVALFLAGAIFSLPVMFSWRKTRQLRRESHVSGARNILIIGNGRLGPRLARYLQQDPRHNYVVRGFFDDAKTSIGDFARLARREFIDEVILTAPLPTDAVHRMITEAQCNKIDVKIVPDCFEFDPATVRLERFGNIPVFTLNEEPVPSVELLIKRCVDIFLSAACLVVVSPLLSLIALLVKLDSPGPAFYSAPRVGRKGHRFLCYKFRTMVSDADALKKALRTNNEREGPFFKIADDPRITRVGRFLRRYSLDELPQLWNVLRGEMSMVGPRPHPVDDTDRYSVDDWQRLEVTPGLTGLWQVTARQDPSFARSMELDRQYIGQWTLGMDFRILFRTIAAVLRGEGA